MRRILVLLLFTAFCVFAQKSVEELQIMQVLEKKGVKSATEISRAYTAFVNTTTEVNKVAEKMDKALEQKQSPTGDEEEDALRFIRFFRAVGDFDEVKLNLRRARSAAYDALSKLYAEVASKRTTIGLTDAEEDDYTRYTVRFAQRVRDDSPDKRLRATQQKLDAYFNRDKDKR